MNRSGESLIDELLEEPCYVIDFLPERVPADSQGHFFEIEEYFLNHIEERGISNKFSNIILKLMCYFRAAILWKEWNDNPTPENIVNAVREITNNHNGELKIIFPEEYALLLCQGNFLNISVFNPSDDMQRILSRLALSEGLFWWKSES